MVDLSIQLPENFLKEEVRDGFLVSEKIKQIWAVELDLLNKFIDICNENDLQYSAFAGTLLGAIRHGGMIPWDDDIDVIMPRKDYEIFCDIAQLKLTDPYFLQTNYTDKGSLRGHAQIRRSDTAAMLKDEKKVKINQGIFIDIFPMDYVFQDEKKLLVQKQKAEFFFNKATKMAFLSKSRFIPSNDAGIKGKSRNLLFPVVNCIIELFNLENYYYKKFEETISMCKEENALEMAPLSFQFDEKRWRHKKNELVDLIEVPFEFLKIKVPKLYDDILKREYGNYMKFVVGTSVHGSLFFDTEKSYKYYLNGD